MPIKGMTFIQHLFNAYWQQDQYESLKESLKRGEHLFKWIYFRSIKILCNVLTLFSMLFIQIYVSFTTYAMFLVFSYSGQLLLNFAENRKALYHLEVKSAHFIKAQVTLHPTVAYYKDENGQLVRHVLIDAYDR